MGGGLSQMSKSMEKGMVLVMSIWDDHEANMLWLDSTYPKDKTSPGGPRGTCSTDSVCQRMLSNSTPTPLSSTVTSELVRLTRPTRTWSMMSLNSSTENIK